MMFSLIQKIVTASPSIVGPWVHLGFQLLNARISPLVNAVLEKLPVMAAPPVNDICTSCNVPLVSYCCAAEGTKRADITTNCAQKVPLIFEFNTPQITAIANYAQYFLGIDIDSFRLAISQQIIAPCPHRERDPEVTIWKRMPAPSRPSKKGRRKVNDNTDISLVGQGRGYWADTKVAFPGGYRGKLSPRPYLPLDAYYRIPTPEGIVEVKGSESRVMIIRRLHERDADMRYKYIDRQTNYKSWKRQGTPAVPRRAVVGQLERVEVPKWFRRMQIQVMNDDFWKHGIRIRPQRNGNIDPITGHMEYNDAFYQEGAITMYPRILNLGKDIPGAPTIPELWLATPPRPEARCLPPLVMPNHLRYRSF